MPKNLTHERLLSLLRYDPRTGLFVRLVACRGQAAGKVVGTTRDDGRRSITIDGGRYLASRLAWFYITGKWPKIEVDHINCVYGDDRFCNLREATRSQNTANRRRVSYNKSGLKGVSWNRRDKKWVAFAGPKYLGSFNTKEAAHLAYLEAAKSMYGEFARAQ